MGEVIQWNASYSVGIPVIDEQHQHLIEIIQTLRQTLETTTGEISTSEFFKEAVGYGEYHFQTEEAFFSRFTYPEREAHLAAHQSYKEKVRSLLIQQGESRDVALELLAFLEDWWITHITGMDQTLRDLAEAEQQQAVSTTEN